MRQILVVLCLLTCLLIPISTADSDNQEYWEVDLENGYISTKPIFVDNQVIVRILALEEFGLAYIHLIFKAG